VTGGHRISLQAVSDFMERIRKYEEVYEPIIDRNMHYIKLTDMVTGRGHLDINRISGYLPGKIVGFLLQVGKRQLIVYQQPPSIDNHFNMLYTPAINSCTPITQGYNLNTAAASHSQTTCMLCKSVATCRPELCFGTDYTCRTPVTESRVDDEDRITVRPLAHHGVWRACGVGNKSK
jgi:hypothetical protein